MHRRDGRNKMPAHRRANKAGAACYYNTHKQYVPTPVKSLSLPSKTARRSFPVLKEVPYITEARMAAIFVGKHHRIGVRRPMNIDAIQLACGSISLRLRSSSDSSDSIARSRFPHHKITLICRRILQSGFFFRKTEQTRMLGTFSSQKSP
jgi:hypothetical protein